MYTLNKFVEALQFNDEGLIDGDMLCDTYIEDDNLDEGVTFYHNEYYRSMLHISLDARIKNHIFNQVDLSRRVVTLLSHNKGKINPNWVDMFCNPKLLRFINEINERVDIHCNTGTTTTNKVGYLKRYGMVWCDPNGM